MTPALPFERVHHVGIAVNDLETALAFYRDLLRMEQTSDETLAAHGVRAVFLAAPRAGGTEIELLLPAGEDSPVARFLARRGPGLHHVAFAVPDISAALGECRRRGLRLIDDSPRRGARGHLVAFLHPEAAQGVLVELVETHDPR